MEWMVTLAGALYAVASAFCFGLWNIYLERALRAGAGYRLAVFVMTLSMTVFFLPLVLLVGWQGGLPPLNWSGVAWFAAAGVLASCIGPLQSAAATRLVGTPRTVGLRLLDPLFTYVIAFTFLGERLYAATVIGVALIIAALGLLRLEAYTGGDRSDSRRLLAGLVWGVSASVAFSIASVFRKLGLTALPAPLVGGLTESVVGLVLMTSILAGAGNWAKARAEVHRPTLDLWLSGFTAGGGTLLINLALQRLPVSVAVALRNTAPWFVLPLAPLMLPGSGRPRRWTWVSTALLTVGMLLIVTRH